MKFLSGVVLLLAVNLSFAQDLQKLQGTCDDDVPELECSQLKVPQNWEKPNGQTLTLPIKVFKATSESRGAVFWFSGGPGQTNMDYKPPQALRANYDVVLVGFRGMDGSVKLTCPEMQLALKGNGDDLLSASSAEGIRLAAQGCAIRLENEGVDLDGFNMAQVLQDMEVAREALGYGKINLLAGSYGTRLSQLYMRLYPQSVNRAVLIGTGVPGGFIWKEEVIEAQLNKLNDYCQADPECSGITGNLVKTIDDVLDNAPASWLVMGIDKGKVRATTFGMLYHRQTASQAIDAYLAAAQGDYSGLALMSLAYNYIFPGMMTWGDFLSKGFIDYESDVDYFQTVEVQKEGAFGSPLTALLMDAGEVWPTKQPEIDETTPIVHEILILNGTLDFSTPLMRIEDELMPMLPNASLVRFKGFGHVSDLLYKKNVKEALVDFYTSGKTDLNPKELPFAFDVGFGFPEIAKVSLAAVIVLPLLIGFLIYCLVRRIRKKRLARVPV